MWLKGTLAGCGVLFALSTAQAQFTWPLYESFSGYTNLNTNNRLRTGASSNFWNFGNGTGGFTTGPTTQITYPGDTAVGQLTVTVRVTALDAADGLALTTITIANPGGCTALAPGR